MKLKCEGQKPFKVRKNDKLILIIDSHPDKRQKKVNHELIRIDFVKQLSYFAKFLKNFISNKKTINTIISACKYDLKAAKKGLYNNSFSSYRINDKSANIDFMEYQEIGILYIFMVVTYKKKPKTWWAKDYFKNS